MQCLRSGVDELKQIHLEQPWSSSEMYVYFGTKKIDVKDVRQHSYLCAPKVFIGTCN